MKRKNVLIFVLLIVMALVLAVCLFVKARDESQRKACANNMHMIEHPMECCIAMVWRLTDGDIINPADVLDYLPRGKLPKCPASGAEYNINYVVDGYVTCPYHGDLLHHGERSPQPIECTNEWNRYRIPELHFEKTPISNVIEAVNEAVRKASTNVVPQAVVLGTNEIVEVVNQILDPELREYTYAMMVKYKEFWLAKNQAHNRLPYTGSIGGKLSVEDSLIRVTRSTGTQYRKTPEHANISIKCEFLECHEYKVSKKLADLVQEEKKSGKGRADTVSVASVFAAKGGLDPSNWTMNLPDGSSKSFFDAVVMEVPSRNMVLVIDTSYGCMDLKDKLKKTGLWRE